MKYFILLSILFFSLFSYSQCPAGPSGSCDGSGTSLDLYWVGTDPSNNGNWNSPCSWRVGSILGFEPCQSPRSIDNVFFVAGSFIGGVASTITINTQARCNNLFIDPVINALPFTPGFNLENPGFLEVYGSFTLQSNIFWTVVGGNATGPEILFKSTNSGNTIQTASHTMGAVQFDGIGGEWALQDDYNGGSLNFVFGFLTTSDGASDYNMNLLTFDSDVKPGGTNANRRIDLNSSTITLTSSSSHDRYPYNTTNAPKTVWECRGTSVSNFTFNAGTSTIIFTATSPFLRLGGINYNVIKHTGTGRFYDHFGPNPCNIDTLETNGYLYFHHQHVFNVLKINSTSLTHNFFRNQTITNDLIVNGNPCNPTVFESQSSSTLTMPAVVSADPMNGFTINNLRCNDGTAGHAVNGNGLGTTTGWIISAPLPRDLYWVGDTTNNWSDPMNWSTSSTGVPVMTTLDCPPQQTDNVFFIPALANGKTVTLNQISYCNNQTWTITAPTTFNGSSLMNIYGNLQLDPDINFACTGAFNFYGNSNNTILSAGKTLPSTSYIRQFADYTLLDDLNFNAFYLFQQNNFNAGGFDLTGNRLLLRSGTQNLSGSTITLAGSTPWSSNGNQGTTIYNASSHVIFTNSSTTTRISGWGPNLKFPNFTLQSPNTTLRFVTFFGAGTNNCIFEGDVNLNGSVEYYANSGTGIAPSEIRFLTILGDLNLSAGKLYEFGVVNTITVAGNLNAIGSCSSSINIQGIAGTSFNINIAGSSNLDYCNISDMNSTGVITATNSLNAGNNTNITFPAGAGTTYYWRALASSCPACNYDGNWNSTAGYWTTNSANIEGVPGCIPGPFDNVVFDNASFSGGTSTITISSTISCHDITVTASNVNITGTGNLKITGSILSDGTLTASSFTGALDFVSNNALGENIDFGGVGLGCTINFANANGSWTLINNQLSTTKDLNLISGSLNTNGETLIVSRFNSNNSGIRSLNLGNSTFNITGSGSFFSTSSPTNIYTWNTTNTSNFIFNAGSSTVNFTNTSEPTVKSAALAFHHINFTSTSSIISSSPVLLVNNWQTTYMKFDCSARIYGNNSYDTLEFTAGNVYKLEGGSTQTLNAPNGILISTGVAGNEIAIKSINTGTPAIFHKLNTGGSMASFCFDHVSVEDNLATSDDPIFSFFTGINSNDISATGIWNFTNPVFFTPTVNSGTDQYICSGTSTILTWNILGSGPYKLTYTENGINPVTVNIPHGTLSYTVSVNPTVDSEYEITSFTADNCGINTVGNIADNNQWVYLPSASPISINNDVSSCILNNEGSFIHFHENQNGTERPLLSIFDKLTGSGLGNVTTRIQIDGTVQTLSGVPYLQRRYGIDPTIDESARVRLYFTQTELNALSAVWGSPLNLTDLRVTKYSNNMMNFTGAAVLLVPTASGNIPGGITTTANIFYVEIDVASFSHFVIHPPSVGPLPIELISFNAKLNNDIVNLTWQTASEINNDYFTLEKSKDALNWTSFAEQTGAGNSNSILNYTDVDVNPFKGISYYRLKQTDFNGDFEYSKIVTINNQKEGAITVYPNPVKDILTITNISKQHHVKVYSSNGQIVYQGNTKTINTSNWSAGLYQIIISDVSGKIIEKIKVIK